MSANGLGVEFKIAEIGPGESFLTPLTVEPAPSGLGYRLVVRDEHGNEHEPEPWPDDEDA